MKIMKFSPYILSLILLAVGAVLYFSEDNALSSVATVPPKYGVDSAWLNKNLDSDNIIIYDTRDQTAYNNGHITGAINFPTEVSFKTENNSFYVKGKNEITPLLREKGIDTGKLIVLYDGGDFMHAARIFWVLELYGISNVVILEDGYSYWDASGYPSSKQIVIPHETNYIPSLNADVYANTTLAKVATFSSDYQLYDSRTREEYIGEKSETEKYGHIPKAKSILISSFYSKNKDGVRVLKSQEEMNLVFSSLDKTKKSVTYCNKGLASTLSYYLMKRSGFDVAHYDGSWLDWSSNELPIEK
jgi:thiosulfate/3-mercaptopyruvate sulfurtransferase